MHTANTHISNKQLTWHLTTLSRRHPTNLIESTNSFLKLTLKVTYK